MNVPIAEIMRQLSSELQLNDFGLPLGIYRSDLLPFHLHVTQSGFEDQSSTESTPPHNPLLESTDSNEVTPKEVPQPPIDPIDTVEGTLAADLADPLLDNVDAHAILAGNAPNPTPRRQPLQVDHALVPTPPKEYRIAGFPADSIQSAYVPLQYDEGFPAFGSGTAFWDKLCYEPADAFALFQRYCQMARGIAANYEDEDAPGEAASGTRSISTLVDHVLGNVDDTQILVLLDKIKDHYNIYYWNLRVRAYDLYRAAQHRQQQELRAIETQDDHYIQARKFRHRLAQYMDSDEEFWDLMTPKVAIDMFKSMTQLERISAGVPAAGPPGENERSGQPMEVTLRSIAQVHRGEAKEGTLVDEHGTILDVALEDQDTTKLLQELIIRTGGNN